MGFKRVKFQNFRNIKTQEIKMSGGLNLLTGQNGSGKTNILEGLNILSGWGPLEGRTRIQELATRESGKSEVLFTGQKDNEFGDIIQVRAENRFSIRYNDKNFSATELRFKMPVLCFLPNDIQLVEGNPSRRRRLLNMLLAQIIPSYSLKLYEYNRALKQKAALLKKGEKTQIINRVLSPLAAWIWRMRREAVGLLSLEMEKLENLVPKETELFFSRGGGNCFEEEQEDFENALLKAEEKEKICKVPLVGPHRDDILIKNKQKNAAEILSRGYRRRLAIALMLSTGDGILRKTGNVPTLLLDEVTAELDAEGREILFGTLQERKAQVFAATAEPFAEYFAGSIYKVEKGYVELIKG